MVTDAMSKDRRLFASDAFVKISSLVCIYLNVVFLLTVFLLLQTNYDVLLERCAEHGRHPHPRLVDPHCHHHLCHGRDRAQWLDPSQVNCRTRETDPIAYRSAAERLCVKEPVLAKLNTLSKENMYKINY
jgi:hypothetical protein